MSGRQKEESDKASMCEWGDMVGVSYASKFGAYKNVFHGERGGESQSQ